ncbi:hypothetical protein [Pseudomonas farris]
MAVIITSDSESGMVDFRNRRPMMLNPELAIVSSVLTTLVSWHASEE